MCLSISLPISLTNFLFLCVDLTICVYRCLPTYISFRHACISFYLSYCMCLSISVPISLTNFLFLCVDLNICVYRCLPTHISFRHACISFYLSYRMCLSISVPIYLSNFLILMCLSALPSVSTGVYPFTFLTIYV